MSPVPTESIGPISGSAAGPRHLLVRRLRRGFQAEFTTGFDDEVDRLGWIAIYPDSVLDGWMAYGYDDSGATIRARTTCRSSAR